MPLVRENVQRGLPPTTKYQSGRSNVDDGVLVEQGVGLPWVIDPATSYMYYDCKVEVMLDSGIVIHNRLPQTDSIPDTLASAPLDNPNLNKLKVLGVNLKSQDQYTDIKQRMAHSRYWFRLSGQALRVGYRVPIPGIKTIGGVPAVPYDRTPQWAFNRLWPGGNYGGVPLWHAAWSLWYTTLVPPTTQTIPAEIDLAAHLSSGQVVPTTMQAPFSRPDDNVAPSPIAPILPTNLFRGPPGPQTGAGWIK